MSSSSGEKCLHCDCELSKKTYETHKRLYYDNESDQWIKKRCLIPSDYKKALATTEVALEEFDPEDHSEEESIGFDRPPLIELDDESDISLEENIEDLFTPQEIEEVYTFDEEGNT